MWSQGIFTSICELKLLFGAEWGWWLLEQTNWVWSSDWHVWMNLYGNKKAICITAILLLHRTNHIYTLDQELDTHLVQQPVGTLPEYGHVESFCSGLVISRWLSVNTLTHTHTNHFLPLHNLKWALIMNHVCNEKHCSLELCLCFTIRWEFTQQNVRHKVWLHYSIVFLCHPPLLGLWGSVSHLKHLRLCCMCLWGHTEEGTEGLWKWGAWCTTHKITEKNNGIENPNRTPHTEPTLCIMNAGRPNPPNVSQPILAKACSLPPL